MSTMQFDLNYDGTQAAFGYANFNGEEATRVMGLIDSYRRTLELTEIEERLQALENAYKISLNSKIK